MAGLGKTIAGRITVSVLAMHLLLLPALYFGMVHLLKQSNEELFLNSTRGHARFLADSLERIGHVTAEPEIVEILDSVVLSGSGVYSELVGDNTTLTSSLVTEAGANEYEEDFRIGEHDDDIYVISMPVLMGDEHLNLKVGFDETPYLDQNVRAYKNGLIIIAVYLAALLLLLPIIGRRVVRPVKELQYASRQIASGDLRQNLTVDSDLVEIFDLSHDLENMKSRLIGINEQLETEISNKEIAEIERRSLEHQLQHSQRLETVGTMAGGIAHELNNILLPIILYTETALEDLPANSPMREDLRRVTRAASRAKGIVNQVLTFSHKMAASDHTAVDMGEVVGDSTDLFRASLPPAVNLEVSVNPHCRPVLGDASLMSQLVLNLCNNALQALSRAEGEISVFLDMIEIDAGLASRFPTLAIGPAVKLVVRDSGHGMDAATIDRIFEPFFTTRPVGGGTGLGLSVVHGIVADLGGVIDVESTVGSGSSFYVYLPAIHTLPHAAVDTLVTG